MPETKLPATQTKNVIQLVRTPGKDGLTIQDINRELESYLNDGFTIHTSQVYTMIDSLPVIFYLLVKGA